MAIYETLNMVLLLEKHKKLRLMVTISMSLSLWVTGLNHIRALNSEYGQHNGWVVVAMAGCQMETQPCMIALQVKLLNIVFLVNKKVSVIETVSL